MTLWQSLLASFQSLRTNMMRSALTILGIVIGVSSVVFLVSFGRGNTQNISKIFESMGANALYITTASTGGPLTGVTASLTLEDADAILNSPQATSVKAVAPMSENYQRVVYANENRNVDIMGVTPDVLKIMDYPLESGAFLNEDDLKRLNSVAVLGHKTSENLFGGTSAVGESIRVGGRLFEVIGVLQEKGAFMSQMDDFVMIPITTMQSKILTQTSSRGRPVQTIAVSTSSPAEIDNAIEQVKTILRQRHNIRPGQDDDFNIIDMREIMNSMDQVMLVFEIFMGAVASISLLVGGIGIMNIMLVSVTERTREIGIRKAVGAKRRDIMKQFLMESSVLSLAGGIIGLLLAMIGAFLITGMSFSGFVVSVPISFDIAAIAVLVALFIGLVSGAYPAFRAASLDPIQSLRHD
jgi:putative ABC transport system permease protein